MTTFGSVFGTGFAGKALLVLLNVMFGLPAVMSWAAFGTVLGGPSPHPVPLSY